MPKFKNCNSKIAASYLLDRNRFGQLLFFFVLFAAALAVFVPFTPNMPAHGLDPSWAFGMNEAVARGFVFGKDIIFTYGPYSSVLTESFHPVTDNLMMIGAMILALSFFLVAFLNFHSANWKLRWALVFALSALIYSRDALFFFYPLLFGVYIFNFLNRNKSEENHKTANFVFLLVALVPFGLYPVIKGSLLVCVLGIAGLSTLMLIHHKRWKLSIILCFVPLLSILFFWIFSGQTLTALPAYFISMAPIISGFTEAMSLEGKTREIYVYVFGVSIMIWALFIGLKAAILDKILVALMFIWTLFLAFKAGFVRHDGHALTAGAIILLVSILLATIVRSKVAWTAFLSGLAVWIYIDSNHLKTSTQNLIGNSVTTYLGAIDGIKNRLLKPEKLDQEFQKSITMLQGEEGIPALTGTVDIYSHDQSFLIASGNEWMPRPILQSYSAYNTKLALINQQHLLGKNAPENLLFKIQPIDERLPSLEDGASWPIILSNYSFQKNLNGYLHLKRCPWGLKQASLPAFDSSQSGFLGKEIHPPQKGDFVFARVKLSKSILGRLVNILFKPSHLQIKLTLEDGSQKIFRFIPNMGDSIFMLSPLIETTDEFSLVFNEYHKLDSKKVKALEIYPKSHPELWNSIFEIDFLTMRR